MTYFPTETVSIKLIVESKGADEKLIERVYAIQNVTMHETRPVDPVLTVGNTEVVEYIPRDTAIEFRGCGFLTECRITEIVQDVPKVPPQLARLNNIDIDEE